MKTTFLTMFAVICGVTSLTPTLYAERVGNGAGDLAFETKLKSVLNGVNPFVALLNIFEENGTKPRGEYFTHFSYSFMKVLKNEEDEARDAVYKDWFRLQKDVEFPNGPLFPSRELLKQPFEVELSTDGMSDVGELSNGTKLKIRQYGARFLLLQITVDRDGTCNAALPSWLGIGMKIIPSNGICVMSYSYHE